MIMIDYDYYYIIHYQMKRKMNKLMCFNHMKKMLFKN